MDPECRTPWAVAVAKNSGGQLLTRLLKQERGGKMDDCSVLVALVH